jgi:hypothetical protein
MEWIDAFRAQLPALPNLTKFAIIMAVLVGVPALTRRARIPDLVGLLFTQAAQRRARETPRSYRSHCCAASM